MSNCCNIEPKYFTLKSMFELTVMAKSRHLELKCAETPTEDDRQV